MLCRHTCSQDFYWRKSELTLEDTGMNDFYWRKSELTLEDTGMNDFYWGKWQLTLVNMGMNDFYWGKWQLTITFVNRHASNSFARVYRTMYNCPIWTTIADYR